MSTTEDRLTATGVCTRAARPTGHRERDDPADAVDPVRAHHTRPNDSEPAAQTATAGQPQPHGEAAP